MHEVHLPVLAEQELLAEAAGVGVLVEEALARRVDDDAPHQRAGRRERDADLDAVEPHDLRAGAVAHGDPATVVERVPDGHVAAQGRRAVLLHQRVVEDEAAGGEHHAAAGPDGPGGAVDRRLDADDRTVVDHEPLDHGVGLHPRRRLAPRPR